MVLVLILVTVLWIIGVVMKVPVFARLMMIGMLYAGVLIAVMVLPPDNGLRVTLGGGLKEWVLLGGVVAVIAVYRSGLKWLHTRANKNAPVQPETDAKAPFKDVELERYMRHIILREIGGPGQRKLKDARVLVIGAGGLGAPVLQYLAASGVGTIGVMDDDHVDASNLQRQVIHVDKNQGMPKVFSAEQAMRAQNPFIEVKPYNRRFDDSCSVLLSEYDLVIDGSDNFDTRYLVNTHCVAGGVPLLSAAITQWEGQISLYDSANNTPCYQCVFPTRPADGMVPSCAEAGVAAPLPGILGTMLAMEAIKHITGAGQGLGGRLMIYDALYAETRVIKTKKRADCPICAG
ncbi:MULTISPECIES: HesA/MoeB/ThiF family protein [Pacificibacter]|uniref:HesA/MoeB/ThiF family protein n=1 Tax=Pacificibacter TaxID=1042323 RepID=UPI001C091F02|nr:MULTISPECIES: molybdopterin-synthase adenylyltransferase MoeB [Pacificibacter]MBU2937663.1 molybdopterin-synthase adenylyltransferase MoeB [Pacificibacter marinus]MDO6616157.1 molybdopterin-synthase adenylyltransferase MoeB [Pacificibacter sp. 1_MG-2023]